MSRRWGAWLAAPVLVLAPAAGCAPAADGPLDGASATTAQETGSSETGTTGPPETLTATTPAPEAAGTASAQAPVVRPAVTVPQLPIGGAGQDGEFEQCVSVNFRDGGGENPIPDGVRITVTGVALNPPLLELGGPGCSAGDRPPCLSEAFAFTADNTGTEAGRCSIPVRGTGEWPAEDRSAVVEQTVELSLAGVVECPGGEEAWCADVAGRVAASSRSIDLVVAVADAADVPTSSAPESMSASEPTATSDSSQETHGTPTQEATPSDGTDAPRG